jgi:hypothetical protein
MFPVHQNHTGKTPSTQIFKETVNKTMQFEHKNLIILRLPNLTTLSFVSGMFTTFVCKSTPAVCKNSQKTLQVCKFGTGLADFN